MGDSTYVNHIEQIAAILARHGQEDRLRDFVAGAGGVYAAYRLPPCSRSPGD
ncbi:hypothetical protein GCM10022255_109140 [Dactylosporangium darangshiense]|uniref:Uncharacterized protein n=1 Tax=Dactylosporangium darangshiense TaxID=579108 RepID=A0ABP8DUB2_9ACTN